MAGDEQKEGEGEMVTVPRKVLRDHADQVNASIRKYHEGEAAEREKLRKENEELRARDKERESRLKALEERIGQIEQNPFGLSKYVEGVTRVTLEEFQKKVDDGTMQRVIQPLIEPTVPKLVAGVLPDEIRKQGGLIAQVTKEKLEEMAPVIAERVVEKEEGRIRQGIADAYNELEGREPATFKETVEKREKERKAADERHRKNRRRNKLIAIVGVAALALLGIATGWTAYYSSKRTAEGAAGTAGRAMATAEEANKTANKSYGEANSLRADYRNWTKAQEDAKKKESEEKSKKEKERDEKLTRDLADRYTKTQVDTELAKVAGRANEANTKVDEDRKKAEAYERLIKETRTIADENAKKIGDFEVLLVDLEKKGATKEELAGLSRLIEKEIKPSMAQQDASIKKLQTNYTDSKEESERQKRKYDAYNDRIATLEKSLNSLLEKPKGNGNYQPPERDR